MGDEDDVTGWSWAISVVGGSVLCVGMVVCRRRPDLPWCADVRCVRSHED
jgi:hypothetical protein